MRNKLILFLMLALFGSTSFLRADEVTIGDPSSTTTNSYLPTYSLYNYSFTQQIYTADEIGMGGTINDVTMWLKNTSSYARNLNVYMKEVSEAAFADGSAWVSMTANDLVATGTLENGITDPVAKTFTLSTPFNYSGDGNLVICFQDVTGSWSSGAASVVMTANGNQAIYAYRDPALYDPTTPGVNGYVTTSKSVVRLTIQSSAPQPPVVPTGDLAITPYPFELGDRPTNGWMEPFAARIYNGGGAVTVTANVSNTAGVEAFSLSENIEEIALEYDEAIDFEVNYNHSVADGEYTEQLTLFSVNNDRNINVVPITANLYTAGAADIVETAVQLDMTFTRDNTLAMFSHMPTADDLHANYMLQGMTAMAKDAVYWFNLSKDVIFNVSADGVTDCIIAVYNFEDEFHPTAAVEPVLIATNGQIENQILLAGKYYMIFAGDNFLSMSGTAEAVPAPTDLTYIAPADGLTEVEAPVTLTWEGGLNATQYQVLFGTSPVNMDIALDWTIVDDNYGSYTITSLDANTQYFWQINVKNSNGTIEGPRWGFTTTLTTPSNVTASAEQIFTDESTLIKWRHNNGQGFTGEITVADGTTTNSYIPVYGLWVDDFTRSEMIYPASMLEEMEGGEITSLTYYISSPATGAWDPAQFNVYMMEVDATTLSSYYGSTNATVVYSGSLNGTGTTMTINLTTPYVYGGGNLLIGIEEPVEGTYKSCSFYGIDATGASASGYSGSSLSAVTFNQRNFLPKTTFVCGGKGGNRNLLGYNVYYGDVKANDELILEKQYLLENLPYNMEGHNVSVTAVYTEGESTFSNPVVVYVSGYGNFTGQVTELISGNPVAGANVKFTGKDEFQNNVMFEATTNANGIYTINNAKAGNYTGVATLEGMEPSVQTGITLAYNTTETVNFIMHEVYNPVFKVFAQELDPTTAKVTWSLYDFVNPSPVNPTPGPGGSASTFTEGFESGLPSDWSVVDANNDGYTWCLTSAIPSTWTYYASMSLDWYHTGSNAICSGSYINGVGALNPDEYLVMGQQTLAAGSTLSFWAAATDASYPADHFGVFVSDNGSDWTSVQEWTLTGKKGANDGGLASREGKGAKIGTWYNYSVDLSAYAGQKYIAFRHFSCYDQYIMCIDDIELSAGSKADRSVENYRVYRKAILKEAELVEADSVCFPTIVYAPDSLYADFDWNNVEPGLYQYGVSAIYPSPAKGGNRDEVIIGEGTGTNSYVPTYNLYNYSCTNQIYTGEEIGGAGTINSIAFMPTTVNDPMRNLNIYMVNSDKTTFASGTDWTPVTDADLVYSGPVNWTLNDWSTIQLTNPFMFDGSNLIIVVNDLTGSWTSSNYYKTDDATAQAINIYQDAAPYNPSSPGSGTVRNFKNQIKLDITFGTGGTNDDPITPITWSNILPKDMETVVKLRAVVPDAATAEGVTFRFHNTFEQVSDIVYTFTAEDDTVTFDNFRKGEYEVTASLNGYESNLVNTAVSIWEPSEFLAIMSENFKPVEVVTVSKTGYAQWTDMMPERYAERYIVTLDDALYAETTVNALELDPDFLTVGQTYQVGVAVVYTTGMSAYVKKNFTYLGCESVSQQVEGLAVDSTYSVDMDVVLVWNGGTPNPNPNPNPNPGPTGGFTEGFENGMPSGWTVLDNNNDGYSWCMTSAIPSTWTYYASLSLDWYRTGTNAICSGSYINGVGAITPDEYLVTNQVTPVAGSTFSFWAAATDGNYPADHFGVAVSTTTATASAFTMLNEWTLTAKDGGVPGGRASRDGNGGKLATWREYSVDLSAYAGQNIYIAIRHFNCNDQYIMCVDDITFTTDAKSISGLGNTGVGYGTGSHTFTRDWYYYDNGSNTDAIGLTSGGGFYWGIMIPSFEGNVLSKVAYFDYAAHSGQIMIYQGGSSAPQNLIYTQNYTVNGTENYIEIPMDTPVELDDTQNLWVVMHNTSGQYVAAIDSGPGVANGSCISTDGATWYNTISSATSGSIDGNWNLRAYVETSGGATASTFQKGKYNILVDGVVVGTTPANVTTFTYTCPDYENHLYEVVWVDNEFGISCRDGVEYQILPVSVGEFDVVNAIYPNPTSDDLHINAAGMTRISVVNALGQVVYDREVKCDEMVIKMAQFGNGVYSVRIATDNGTSVKRVVVNK